MAYVCICIYILKYVRACMNTYMYIYTCICTHLNTIKEHLGNILMKFEGGESRIKNSFYVHSISKILFNPYNEPLV